MSGIRLDIKFSNRPRPDFRPNIYYEADQIFGIKAEYPFNSISGPFLDCMHNAHLLCIMNCILKIIR